MNNHSSPALDRMGTLARETCEKVRVSRFIRRNSPAPPSDPWYHNDAYGVAEFKESPDCQCRDFRAALEAVVMEAAEIAEKSQLENAYNSVASAIRARFAPTGSTTKKGEEKQ